MKVYRLEIATGRKELWRTLMPADAAGVSNLRSAAHAGRDGLRLRLHPHTVGPVPGRGREVTLSPRNEARPLRDPRAARRRRAWARCTARGTRGSAATWRSRCCPASFSQDADRLRRFEQEARAAGVLNHPNITAVYDLGTHDGAPYIVTELLEGETLRARLSGRRAAGDARRSTTRCRSPRASRRRTRRGSSTGT